MNFLRSISRRLDSWVQFTVLRRPRSVREAANRAFILALVVFAAVAPVFISSDSGEVDQGASDEFAALQAELAEARDDLEALDGDSAAAAALRERIAELEDATRLGYIERDGDAARRNALAPDFRLLDLEGDPVRLADFDTPLVLNFWASWCQPCIQEMPDFQRLHEQYGDRLAMIGVNDGEDLATAAEFAGPNRTNVQYRILIDPSKSLTDGPYRLIGRPTTYYIDADGIIRDIRVGEHDLETMRELAANLLGEEPAEPSAEEATGDYAADAAALLESITANFNAARAEFSRAAEDAALYDDPAWRRNAAAQASIWQERIDRWRELEPPAQYADLHTAVNRPLNVIRIAADLLTQALDAQDQSATETAIQTFQTALSDYAEAADDLSDVLEAAQ